VSERKPPGHGRLPSLDGLRALSIALVLLSHLLGTPHFPMGKRALGAAGDIGYLGVRVFFVISGFLITALLLSEHERTRTISLKDFYIRRFYRILPAFAVFVIAMLIAEAVGAIHLGPRDVLHALTYTTNYHYERAWQLGHIWSLSIEEQFYLLWPALLLMFHPRRAAPMAIAMIALAPLCRIAAWLWAPYRDDVIMEAYPCVMDSIAAGCLLVAARPWLDRQSWYTKFLGSPWFWLVPLAVLAAELPSSVQTEYVTDITVMNLGLALCVDRFVRFPDTWSGRLLNWRPLVWIGTLSYSLYLWQEPFLDRRDPSDWTVWPLNLGLALCFAVASFYLVEKPFLALRDRRARARRARVAAATSATSATAADRPPITAR
jgi:peptidoglycan/LPS O-acetylase OafA/YrhL